MSDSNTRDSHTREALDWIEGCKQWLDEHCTNAWYQPYYMNFMFEPLAGPPSAVIAQMHKAIIRFYKRFSTRFARNGLAASEREFLPLFWLFPDKPKRNGSVYIHDVTFNDNGTHFNGPMLIPRISRLKGECPIRHIEENQKMYACRGIERIHVKKAHDLDGLADYAAKTVKWGRIDPGGILVLPQALGEVKRSASPPQDPQERAIKDIQAAFNVSRDLALRMLSRGP